MPSMMPYQIPFRHLCNLIQIADGNIEKVIADIDDIKAEQIEGLRRRCACAKYWVEECAPEEFKFQLCSAGLVSSVLNDDEKTAVKSLRDDVIAHIDNFTDDKTCAEAIYDVAKKHDMDGKVLFRAAYQALIGKDQGPRLANFLRTIDKDRLLHILNAY
jgi:lysyl-tRNA synthetase class 1